ncbi:type II toxin-antitoxin system VapC family toxin [Oerskovia sp. KBS0722]|uniref:type II toxin-antitoxin system VapC family toxin n=1 Tax=Oerskovia sp. KBS0722 TaxID=1179673 RepID=UPI00110E007B|nr:type II toxin-antitoxin system VapC family toxin [Oerskovia sp. KBS0722]QDW61957.1 type II toxin-antitoxin system VapC family toxin [Oerskovia sp. KBS0722]
MVPGPQNGGRTAGPDLSADDAAYVALAERLDAVLVTATTRRSRTPGVACEIEAV